MRSCRLEWVNICYLKLCSIHRYISYTAQVFNWCSIVHSDQYYRGCIALCCDSILVGIRCRMGIQWGCCTSGSFQQSRVDRQNHHSEHNSRPYIWYIWDLAYGSGSWGSFQMSRAHSFQIQNSRSTHHHNIDRLTQSYHRCIRYIFTLSTLSRWDLDLNSNHCCRKSTRPLNWCSNIICSVALCTGNILEFHWQSIHQYICHKLTENVSTLDRA